MTPTPTPPLEASDMDDQTNTPSSEEEMVRKVLGETEHSTACAVRIGYLRPLECDCDRSERAMLTYGRLIREAAWQPIETAPKDEMKPVCLFNGEVTAGSMWESGWIDIFQDWMAPQPTHWRPLPAAPLPSLCGEPEGAE